MKALFPKTVSRERRDKIREYAQLEDEELYALDTADLDAAAFGFSRGDTMDVPLDQIHIRFRGDLENAEHVIPDRQAAEKWRSALRKPVEIKMKKGLWELQDGHHRYTAAKLLGESTLLAEVEPDDNPITALRALAKKLRLATERRPSAARVARRFLALNQVSR